MWELLDLFDGLSCLSEELLDEALLFALHEARVHVLVGDERPKQVHELVRVRRLDQLKHLQQQQQIWLKNAIG